MLRGLMGRLSNFIIDPSSPSKKLLDININFDGRHPVITYTYFDKENKTEIIETYEAYSMSIKEDSYYEKHTLVDRHNFFDRTFELRDMHLLKTEINKLQQST